jgi:hypothetical protein
MASSRQSALERTPWLRLVRTESSEPNRAPDPHRQLQRQLQRALFDKRVAAADALDAYADFLDDEFRAMYAQTLSARASGRSRRTAIRLRDRDCALGHDDRAAMELVIDRIESRLSARWPEADPLLSSWAAAIGSALRHVEAMALMDLASATVGMSADL